jgi:hypothetical protein
LGPDHPETFWEELGLGFSLARTGKFAEAREVLAPHRERSIKVLGPDHLYYSQCCEFLALAEEGLGHLEAAEKLLAATLEIRARHYKEGHSQTLQALAHMARVSLALGKPREVARCCGEIIRFGGKKATFSIGKTFRPPPLDAEALAALEAVFAGRGEMSAKDDRLGTLSQQLNWLAWKTDWLRAYVGVLWAETWLGLSRTSAKPAEFLSVSSPLIESSAKAMEDSPTTPPRFLDDARARLARYREAVARPAPAPAR